MYPFDMIQFLYSAKRSVSALLFALLVLAGMMTGCASDNIHMPDEDMPVVGEANSETYDGLLTTSIPDMPVFVPVTTDDYVKLVWKDGQRTTVDLELGAFDVNVEMMNLFFNIGTMHIDKVSCKDNGDGSYDLQKDAFECQAGKYLTKGSLTGRYQSGKLELTVHYKPGSMPFECKSDFQGTSGRE